jgi:predicted nucleic acid-binding protein
MRASNEVLDANVFVYAYYKPKKKLTEKEQQMKNAAKKIISRISSGEDDVVTTVVQISEVVNILKHGVSMVQLTEIIRGLFMLENVKIVGVSTAAYFAAVELGEDLQLEANDALAVDMMRLNGVKEIYSFDERFDQIEGITRLAEP